MTQQPQQQRELKTALVQAAIVVLFFALWLAIYKFFNNFNAQPGRAIRLTRPVDVWQGIIQPWTAIIYVLLGYPIVFWPFVFNWRWPDFRFVMATYALSSAIGFAAYWPFPLAIGRPPFDGAGVGNWLMRHVVAVDNDANCCPSFHTSFAVLAALLVARAAPSRAITFATAIVAAAICITTITTGQHYAIDVVGGIACAVASYWIVSWLFGPRHRATATAAP